MNMRQAPISPAFGSRPDLSDRDFKRIAALAQREYGIQIEPQKKSMIQSRLSKRMRKLGLSDFGEYCTLVESRDPEERENFISAITTNVTHFYREAHHFTQLQDDVLPGLVDRLKSGAKVRVWSAGCSSGPEPYSIAGSILKVIPDAARHDIKVLATDLDRDVLAKAKAATYEADQCQVPSPVWEAQVLERSKGDGPRKVRPDVASLVEFKQVNLNGTWPTLGKFDVIFCRNVAIYFDRDVQIRLWQRFLDLLQPGGALFIGHSERITGPAKDQLTPNGITAYRKRA